jgi:hypothetical protein
MRICWTPAAAADLSNLAITSKTTILVTGSRLCLRYMPLSDL